VTYINSDSSPDLIWAPRLGASSPRAVGFPGISVPAATSGTGARTALSSTALSTSALSNSAGVHAVPPVPVKAAFPAKPAQADVVTTLLGQTNIHNYMTRAYATGEGASGPPPEPPKRKPV
jgi:hypothetical protein